MLAEATSKAYFDALTWQKIKRDEARTEDAKAQLLEANLDDENRTAPLIERERDRFAADLLTADEFELRVDTILRGAPLWWER